MAAESPWIRRLRPGSGARRRLICFAHAGAGAWSFREWPAGLPEDVDVVGVQLPGREDRLTDPPFSNVPDVVAQLIDVLAPELALPCVFFGHSMGALIAFELVRELRRRELPGPRLLVVSAFRAPQLPRRVLSPHELTDAEFIAAVNERYSAVPDAVASNAELMDLILPGLRGDISICDTYAFGEEAPLDCPIVAFGGRDDDEVGQSDLEVWESQTSAGFELNMFPGGHFFHQTERDEVLSALTRLLESPRVLS